MPTRFEKGWPYALAVALGLFAGYIDFHATEVQAPVLILVLSGLILGCAKPQRAWRWAIILGLSIPVNLTVRLALGQKPLYPPFVLHTFIALIPAFIATYLGVFARWAMFPPES